MNIKDLAKKYTLNKDDFWQLPQNDKVWIITHDAVEKIASQENILMTNIETLNSSDDLVRFLVTMTMGDKIITSVGEADRQNCRANYLGCMAEKRGVDRCVLKLINAYEYGIYSDTEADDFQHREKYTITDTQKDVYQEFLHHEVFKGEHQKINKWWGGFTTCQQAEKGLVVMQKRIDVHEDKANVNGQLKEELVQ